MTDAYISNPVIIEQYELTPGQTFEEQFSLVSLENIWFDQVAEAIYQHELLTDLNALQSRAHNIYWYRQLAYNFHDGLQMVLKDGYFQYDLTGVDDAEERKIIKRVAVLPQSGQLVMKVATKTGADTHPLSGPQLTRFTDYIELNKDAGNFIQIINRPGDQLRITLTVYVDVSIIDLASGALLNTDEDVKPVEVAIARYLDNLEFDGLFVKTFLQSEIEKAPGVKLPLVNSLEAKSSGFDFEAFQEYKRPESGYFKIAPEDLSITYLNKNALAND